MAMKPLKSIKWPDLPDTYWVVQADGSYQQMTVGNAEQLVATVGIEDKVPYNFRTSGGANDIGDREVDKIIGGTVAWNQLVSSGQKTVTITPDGTYTFSTSSVNGVYANANHILFVSMKVKNYNGGKTLRGYCQIGGSYGSPAQDITGTSKSFAWICKPSSDTNGATFGLSNLPHQTS